MILIYLDVKNETIHVHKKDGQATYHFDEIEYMLDDIGNQPCMYVTNYMKTDIGSVAKTVKSLVSSVTPGNSELDDMDSNVHFVHSTIPGVMQVPAGGGKIITFDGPGDCKVLDEDMYNIVKNAFEFRQMLKQGKLAIISEQEMRKYVRASNRDRLKKTKLKAFKDAHDLDSIIVKDDKPGSAADLADNMFTSSGPDDVVTVDIMEETPGSRNVTEEDVKSGLADPGSLEDLFE